MTSGQDGASPKASRRSGTLPSSVITRLKRHFGSSSLDAIAQGLAQANGDIPGLTVGAARFEKALSQEGEATLEVICTVARALDYPMKLFGPHSPDLSALRLKTLQIHKSAPRGSSLERWLSDGLTQHLNRKVTAPQVRAAMIGNLHPSDDLVKGIHQILGLRSLSASAHPPVTGLQERLSTLTGQDDRNTLARYVSKRMTKVTGFAWPEPILERWMAEESGPGNLELKLMSAVFSVQKKWLSRGGAPLSMVDRRQDVPMLSFEVAGYLAAAKAINRRLSKRTRSLVLRTVDQRVRFAMFSKGILGSDQPTRDEYFDGLRYLLGLAVKRHFEWIEQDGIPIDVANQIAGKCVFESDWIVMGGETCLGLARDAGMSIEIR